MEVIKGIPVAPGVATGRVFVLEEVLERVPHHTVSKKLLARELDRLSANRQVIHIANGGLTDEGEIR